MFKKSIIILCLAAACPTLVSAQFAAGEKTFGPKVGYVSHNSSAVAGLVFRAAVSEHVRIVPEVGCAFRNKGEDALMVDLNVHMPFGFGTEKADLYPLAGVAFNSWSTHGVVTADEADVTTHTNRFGLNLGAGFDLRCSESIILNIEAKYTLIKSYSSAYVTAGVCYVF